MRIAPLAFILLLLAAASPTQSQSGISFPVAAPAEVGLEASGLEEILNAARGYQKADEVVGVELLVVCRGRTVLHEAFGWKNREAKEPMRRGTLFNIRSMTKPILGTAVQILLDEEWFEPTDAVAEYLPPFEKECSAGITIEQLLQHRSGLPWEQPEKPWAQYPSLYDAVAYFADKGPIFPPGTDFHYSDPGSDTLAVLIAEVTGAPFEEFLEERIFEPLGMQHSFALTPEMAPREKEIACNYAGSPGNWRRYWKPGDGGLLPYVKGSGTTWYSSPEDYARFLSLWMHRGMVGDQRILSEQAVARALEPVSRMAIGGRDYPTGLAEMDVRYGQHMELFRACDDNKRSGFGHNGSDGTYAWAWPEVDLMVLYFTQSRGHRTGTQLGALIDEHLLGPLIRSQD